MTDDEQKPMDLPALGDERPYVRAVARFWSRVCANPGRVVRGLIWVCGLLVVLDFMFLLPGVDKHAHFVWENGIGFYGAYGFVSCSLIFLISKHLVRPAVKRDEERHE
jgi:hypothetical protein